MIKTIQVSNFKSISNELIPLNNFNVLIGANASGKSNFVDVLRFIHDVIKDRLSSAIGRRLGWENVLTREKDKKEKIKIEILCDLKKLEEKTKSRKKGFKVINVEYTFEAGYYLKRFFIDSEIFKARYKENNQEKIEKFERTRNKIKFPARFKKSEIKTWEIPSHVKDSLFLRYAFPGIPGVYSNELYYLFSAWRFYDLDVNATRNPCYEGSEGFLLEDGHNLASILERLKRLKTLKVRSIYKQILNFMPTFIPCFEDWNINQLYDGSLGFSVLEKGISKPLLPKMVSDGTIRLLSMLLALLYQPIATQLICIDEPERYLHPQVLGPLVEIMRNVSKKTQIIVTTHSTELVKYLNPNEVFMVDKIDNATHIMPAQDVKMINKFLEEFTLDELWLAGSLKERGKII